MDRPATRLTPRFPRTINLETVSTCNAQCVFCPHQLLNKNKNPQHMDDALFEKIMNECGKFEELQEICFALQNEPLMDRRLFQRIGYARQVTGGRPLLVVISNGSLLTADRIEEMLKNPPDFLKISVQGITMESYERAMVGLRFARTMQNLGELARRMDQFEKPEVMISAVCTDDVVRAGYQAIRDFWEAKGFTFSLINVENRAGILTERMAELSSEQWRVKSWCSRPRKQLNILANGDVILCCADWRGEVVAGNVRTQSLYEIWHGDVLTSYRNRLASGDIADLNPCNRCMQADIAMGGESVRNFKGWGDSAKRGGAG